MKFKFKIQKYQTEAVDAVVRVFEGQPFKDFSLYMRDVGNQAKKQIHYSEVDNEDNSGFGNGSIELTDSALLDNVRAVQLDNNIKQSSELSKPFENGCRCALDIEMETGTGKTYCYIKTMYELNKQYGWSKFIVVVPSIAIREGVKKSFQVMEDHFFQQYGKIARYFVYSSKNLNELDNFSSSKDIQVMIINSQAFATSFQEGAKNDAARKIYNKQDDFGSRRPIDVISANRPIIILDEPQKLGGAATKTGISAFKPLFTLNYSATHKDVHNPIYVLDALDAYRKKLVKKIEVKGFELRNLRGTNGFVYLSEIIKDPNKPPRARVAFEVNRVSGIKRESHILGVNDNLYELSAGKNMSALEQYKDGYIIKDIDANQGSITFLNGIDLQAREAVGDVSERDMRRVQIRETILSHFNKEERLFNRGIKCLSLFFIDEVAHYREYDNDGNELLGDYGVMFEEEYISVLNEYITLMDTPYVQYLKSIDVHDTHKGYFSIDKKTNRAVDSVEKRGVCDDISAYDLILKNKERLLSFDEPTRFIFSHSALREGWDNPNVFQICTLKQSNSTVNKRQEVGRGMRLCVNKYGERIDGSDGTNVHDINVLTVIASESYKDFVGGLQTEIKESLYSRPTVVDVGIFEGKAVRLANGEVHIITKEEGFIAKTYLGYNGYIDYYGKLTDKYRDAVKTGDFAEMPPEIAALGDSIHKLVQGTYDPKALEGYIGNASKTKVSSNALNENFYKKEFQDLWKRISRKYAYTVSFDSNELIQKSIAAIDESLYVTELSYVRTTGAQDGASMDFTEGKSKTATLKTGGGSNALYDLVGKIAQGATLTRKTAVAILQGIRPDKFAMFKINPEEFISKVVRYITEQKATMIVDKITYTPTEEDPYQSDIFTMDKVDINRALLTERHVTPFVVYESDTEKQFASDLEHDEDEVYVYAKLPKTFTIPTPVGNYTPDWAIVFYEEKVKYIYFIAETKGSMSSMQLKKIESAKISCAKKLFETLSDGPIRYDVADTYEHLIDIMKSARKR